MEKLLNRETPAYDSMVLGILSLFHSTLVFIVTLYGIEPVEHWDWVRLFDSPTNIVITFLVPLLSISIGGISFYKNKSDKYAKIGLITGLISILIMLFYLLIMIGAWSHWAS